MRSARDVGEVLSVVMTRLDYWKEDPSAVERRATLAASGAVKPPTPEAWQRWINVSRTGFTAHWDAPRGPAGVWFDHPKETTVESRPDLPTDPKWQTRQTLLNRELIVQEGKDGRLAVRFGAPGSGTSDSTAPVFTSAKATPKTTLLAIFAALRYRPMGLAGR